MIAYHREATAGTFSKRTRGKITRELSQAMHTGKGAHFTKKECTSQRRKHISRVKRYNKATVVL